MQNKKLIRLSRLLVVVVGAAAYLGWQDVEWESRSPGLGMPIGKEG